MLLSWADPEIFLFFEGFFFVFWRGFETERMKEKVNPLEQLACP